MKDRNHIDKIFTKNNLFHNYKASENDWLVVKEAALKKEDNRKFPVVWLLFGLAIGMLVNVFDSSYKVLDTNQKTFNPVNNSEMSNNEKVFAVGEAVHDDKSLQTTINIEPADSEAILNINEQNGKIANDYSQASNSIIHEEELDVSTVLNDVHVVSVQSPLEFYENDQIKTEDPDDMIEVADINIKGDSKEPTKMDIVDGLVLRPHFESNRYLLTEKITPIERSLKTPFQLSLMAGLGGQVFGACINRSVLKIDNTQLYAGIQYRIWNDREFIIQQDQDSYSFGLNNRSAELVAKRIHFAGLSIGVRHKVWNNINVEAEITPLYRLNVQGSQSYWVTNLEQRNENINLENRHSRDFNTAVSGELSYAFRQFSLGLGYIRLLDNPYHVNLKESPKPAHGQFYFTIALNL